MSKEWSFVQAFEGKEKARGLQKVFGVEISVPSPGHDRVRGGRREVLNVGCRRVSVASLQLGTPGAHRPRTQLTDPLNPLMTLEVHLPVSASWGYEQYEVVLSVDLPPIVDALLEDHPRKPLVTPTSVS